jgi:GTP cyclohydrolase I
MIVPTVADVMELMETPAPARLAEEWDNAGLQIGRRTAPVRKVRVALDPLPAVVRSACADGIDLLVVHHPLVFRPLRQFDFDAPTGGIVEAAARGGLSIFAAHTNFDAAAGGVNDILARRIGLAVSGPLEPAAPGAAEGMGRIGRLDSPGDLDAVARRIAGAMGLDHVRTVGDPALRVEIVAVCSGSGGGMIGRFLETGAEAFVTGDLKYHEARDIENAGRAAVDIGHFDSERPAMASLARELQRRFRDRGMAVSVDVAAEERNPFRTLASNGKGIS